MIDISEASAILRATAMKPRVFDVYWLVLVEGARMKDAAAIMGVSPARVSGLVKEFYSMFGEYRPPYPARTIDRVRRRMRDQVDEAEVQG